MILAKVKDQGRIEPNDSLILMGWGEDHDMIFVLHEIREVDVVHVLDYRESRNTVNGEVMLLSEVKPRLRVCIRGPF